MGLGGNWDELGDRWEILVILGCTGMNGEPMG